MGSNCWARMSSNIEICNVGILCLRSRCLRLVEEGNGEGRGCEHIPLKPRMSMFSSLEFKACIVVWQVGKCEVGKGEVGKCGFCKQHARNRTRRSPTSWMTSWPRVSSSWQL
jgi:hypothetical protein